MGVGGGPGTASSSALRRYPALVWLAGAVALALLLPSGLNVPNSGPSSLAEYAPVPGQGDGDAPVAELGLGSSGGTGFGAAGAATTTTAAPGGTGGGGRVVRKAGTKRCVGNPPRQTEDLLSPPCVAFFEGDNFGATAKGVTADEVRVVMPFDGSPLGGAQNDRHYQDVVDCAGRPEPEDYGSDILCRAFMRYFNARYQTYGRTVHLFMPHQLGQEEIDKRVDPFAAVDGSTSWSERKVLSVSFSGQDRERYRRVAPYMISFRPDNQDVHAMVSSFLCTKLAGRPARFSGNTLDVERKRVFGVWTNSPMPVTTRRMLDAIEERCGVTMVASAEGIGDPTVPARFRQAGVTTVIVSAVGTGSIPLMTGYATQNGWFPEWFFGDYNAGRDVNTNFYGRVSDQNQWSRAFGITFDYRRDAVREQNWYRAYREACPECPEPDATNYSAAAFFYDQLNMLFYGIQAAGPRLTVTNVDKGLHAIPPNGSPDPYKPAAYFAPGNYSYIKDAMAMWWDPTGAPPGSGTAGCYRLVDSGARRRAGEWREGDADLFRAGDPCQGDSFQG